MVHDISDVLKILSGKIDTLREQCLAMQAELERREDEIRKLEADALAKEREIDRLSQENQFLKVSHRLASSPDDLIEARKKIAGLMRSIRKCIAQLKE